MYKVFFNGSSILLCPKIKKSLNRNIVKIVDFGKYDFVNQIVDDIEASDMAIDFLIEHRDIGELWNSFRSYFTEIPAAGGFVKNRDGAYLFIRRFGVWDLPKGKIEKKESSEMAAVREVEEECGLTGLKVVKPLRSTFHIYRSPFLKSSKNLVLKETKWFLMEYPGSEIPVPQLDEDIEEVRWFAPSEFETVLANTYLNLQEFIEETMS